MAPWVKDPTAAAWVTEEVKFRCLAWELAYAMGVGIKKKYIDRHNTHTQKFGGSATIFKHIGGLGHKSCHHCCGVPWRQCIRCSDLLCCGPWNRGHLFS